MPMIDAREISAVQAKQAGPLKTVDEKKAYTATIQLGSARRWREFGGGKWERDAAKERPGSTDQAMRHVPAIHKIGPFIGATINGLIQEHNDWIKANFEGRLPLGYVNRQLLIFDIRESNEQPLDTQNDNRLTQASLKEIVATAVREAVGGVLSALAKPTAPASKAKDEGKDGGKGEGGGK